MNEFLELKNEIGLAIENKTIEFDTSKQHLNYAERYEKDKFRPGFAIIDKDGELKCMWCQNRPRKIAEIVRLNFTQASNGLTAEEWEDVALAINRHRKHRKGA